MVDMSLNPLAAEVEPCRVPKPKSIKNHRYVKFAAKRCYELADKFVVRYGDDGAALVHGFVYGRLYIAHAWAELGDVVYDGTCKGFYDKAGYYKAAQAMAVRRMTPREAANLVINRGWQYGPCPELEQAERAATSFLSGQSERYNAPTALTTTST